MTLASRVGDAMIRMGSTLAVSDRATGDQGTEPVQSSTGGFPWQSPSPFKDPIGTLFKETVAWQDQINIYSRYQLGRRIVDDPIDDAMANGFEPTTPSGNPLDTELKAECLASYLKHKTRLNRHWRLTRLFGSSALLYNFNDDPRNWLSPAAPGTRFNEVQPIPRPKISQIQTTERIPLDLLWLSFSFGNESYFADASRVLWCKNPKLIEESVEGESVLTTIYNMLNVQIHSDWAIGQYLWRNAGGLLALYAPSRTPTPADRAEALGYVSNHHARTTMYIPKGWMVKEIMRKSGNMAIARTYDLIIKQIAAGSGIPPSILLGQQKSNVFGRDGTISDDQATYFRFLTKIQENMLSPQLLSFWRTQQIAGMISPGEVGVKWFTPETLSPLEKRRRMMKANAIEELMKRMEANPADFTKAELIKIVEM